MKLVVGDLRYKDGVDLYVDSFTVAETGLTVLQGLNGSGKSFFLRQLFTASGEKAGSIKFEKPFTATHEAVGSGYVLIQQNIPLIQGVTYESLWKKMNFPNLNISLLPPVVAELYGRDVGSCSGGENRLMEFVPWTQWKFDILFLDEVESGLDVSNQNYIYSEIARLSTQSSVVWVTHLSKGTVRSIIPEASFYHIQNNLLLPC